MVWSDTSTALALKMLAMSRTFRLAVALTAIFINISSLSANGKWVISLTWKRQWALQVIQLLLKGKDILQTQAMLHQLKTTYVKNVDVLKLDNGHQRGDDTKHKLIGNLTQECMSYLELLQAIKNYQLNDSSSKRSRELQCRVILYLLNNNESLWYCLNAVRLW